MSSANQSNTQVSLQNIFPDNLIAYKKGQNQLIQLV